ncbi:hypothetical protein ACQPZJ_51270 [Actinoplanes sp. CA-054009]
MEIAADELRALVDEAIEDDPTGLTEVAEVRPDLVAPFHLELVDAEVWWVADLYRAMTEETAAELVRRIDAGDEQAAALAHVLASARTETAVAAVRRWATTPPAWATGLARPLEHLGHVGGWELTPTGDLRLLTSPVARALVPASTPDAAPPHERPHSSPAQTPESPAQTPERRQGSADFPPSIASGAALAEDPNVPLSAVFGGALAEGPNLPLSAVSGGALSRSCGWCGMALWRLLDVDGGLLDAGDGRVVVATCVRCGSYATYFTEAGEFALENERPGFLGLDEDGWELPDGAPLAVGAARPTPWAGNAWHAGGSTVGGFPDWIQDAEFPSCPRCARTMPYVGMVNGGDLWVDFGEGCFYLFHDAACGLSAAVYQQS